MARTSSIGARLRSRRGIAVVAVILTVLAVAIVVSVKVLTPKINPTRAMCAEFTDAKLSQLFRKSEVRTSLFSNSWR